MRLYSTHESDRQGEVTLLAVVETMTAVIIAIALVALVGSFWHIVVWSAMGWVFLLRTELSIKRALRMFIPFYMWATKRMDSKIRQTLASNSSHESRHESVASNHYRWAEVIGMAALLLAGSLLIKTAATMWTLLTDPIRTLKAIPENWFWACACLDLAQPPELVPGAHAFFAENPRILQDLPRRSLSRILLDIGYKRLSVELMKRRMWIPILMNLFVIGAYLSSWLLPQRLHIDEETYRANTGIFLIVVLSFYGPVFLVIFFTSPLRLLLYIPSVLCRFALKATAIAYFNLLLIVQQCTSQVPARLQIEQIWESHWWALRCCLSFIFGGFVVLKSLVYSLEIRLVDDWNATQLSKFIALVILPDALPMWQWATLINALIVIGSYFFIVEPIHWRYRQGRYVNDDGVLYTLRTIYAVTGLLGVYSTAATVWIITHHEQFIHIPGIGAFWPKLG